MSTCGETPIQQITRIAFTGAVFAGLGAVLNIYVPAFHKPTHWLHSKLNKANGLLSQTSLGGTIFKDNPLTCHSGLTEFLAINAMETPFIAGAMVSVGALMKSSGIKPEQFKQFCTHDKSPTTQSK